MARNLPPNIYVQVLSDDVPTQRQRKARLLKPPRAHVRHQVQTTIRERQLALMNEESHVDIAVHDGILDLIERREHGLKIRLVQAKGEVCTGERPRNGNSLAPHRVATGCLTRDEPRSIAIAHGRAVWEQCVAIAEILEGVNRDRRNLELSTHGALIERLDVL